MQHIEAWLAAQLEDNASAPHIPALAWQSL